MFYLLRQELYEKRVIIPIMFGIIFFVILFSRYGGHVEYEHPQSAAQLLALAGLVFTSICFSQTMHSKQGQHSWLMLPVYAHEKLIVKILTYSIIFPLCMILISLLSSWLVELLLLGRDLPPRPAIMNNKVWSVVSEYVVSSSIFLAGASYFKKNHFIKTCFTLLLFIVAITIPITIIGWIITKVSSIESINYSNHIDGLKFSRKLSISSPQSSDDILFTLNNLNKVKKALHWGAMPLLFWTITYFQIRKKEAKDGI